MINVVSIGQYWLLCIPWTIIPNRCHYEPHECELKLNGMKYPVQISQVDNFESQNLNISINVFTFENNEIVPLKITRRNARLHHVDLLLLKNEMGSHYCLIKYLNRFLSRAKSNKNKHFFCSFCLHGFIKEDLLKKTHPLLF